MPVADGARHIVGESDPAPLPRGLKQTSRRWSARAPGQSDPAPLPRGLKPVTTLSVQVDPCESDPAPLPRGLKRSQLISTISRSIDRVRPRPASEGIETHSVETSAPHRDSESDPAPLPRGLKRASAPWHSTLDDWRFESDPAPLPRGLKPAGPQEQVRVQPRGVRPRPASEGIETHKGGPQRPNSGPRESDSALLPRGLQIESPLEILLRPRNSTMGGVGRRPLGEFLRPSGPRSHDPPWDW